MSSSLGRCHIAQPSSRAQAGLAKIIFIISTVPPPPVLAVSTDAGGVCPAPTASVVNLNLRLGLTNEIGAGSAVETDRALTVLSVAPDPPNPADSGDSTIDKSSAKAQSTDRSSEGECDPEDSEIKRAGGKENSEITNNSFRDEDKMHLHRGKEVRASEGYLGLLLDAVLHVFGDDFQHHERGNNEKEEEDDKSVAAEGSKARKALAARSKRRLSMNYEETALIVRSKRERIRSLPSRYRDTVMEQWRKPPTASRR